MNRDVSSVWPRLLLVVILAAMALNGQQRKVAITIDDLPRGGDGPCVFDEVEPVTRRLLAPIAEQKIPVTGFVNEGRCSELNAAQLKTLLGLWLGAGAELGNHTSSHIDLNKVTVEEFERDLIRGEAITRPLVQAAGKPLRYFRHPFLHVGLDLEKRRASEKILEAHGYTIAPVTLDNSDYVFAAAYADAVRRGDEELAGRLRSTYLSYMESIFDFFEKRAVEVTGREIPQILLLHVSELNARMMPELLAMMKGRGYRVVTLAEALRDPAYSQADTYAGPGGFSWIHHWSITRKLPGRSEPDEPAWVTEAYGKAARR